MRYGYTALARELNRLLVIDPPLKPQHIDMWNKRRVMNAAGQMFPSPAEQVPKQTALGSRPRYRWDLEPVLTWVLGGIPDRNEGRRKSVRNSWRYPRIRE